MTQEFNKDKWTCPNDRHLQLRAKLNAGWSYRTEKNTLFTSKNSQLSENEILAIQKVLERSQMLEKIEQERVSKLVERLENLKNFAFKTVLNTESTNKCAICGDYFYLLRSSPNSCNICKKLLCSKCCIDTFDYGNESGFKLNLNFFRSNPPSQQVVMLCRICSEQRELWKKSGAWFFKKYPNYLVNSPLNTSLTNTKINQSNNSSTPSSTLPVPQKEHHQVSFTMPTTPLGKKDSIVPQNIQNNPLRVVNKEDSQKSENNISELCESDSERYTNETSNDYSNSDLTKSTSTNSPSTINHIISNGLLLIPNSNKKEQLNNTNNANANNSNSNSNSESNSPTSKSFSIPSSPVYNKPNNNGNADVVKPTTLKLRSRYSFRKPKLLDWCNNQLLNENNNQMSSPNLNEQQKQETKESKSSFKSLNYNKLKSKNVNK